MLNEAVVNPNSFEGFTKRFDDLMKEAQSYGIMTSTVMMEIDPIQLTERKQVIHYAGPIQAVGMLTWGKARLLAEMVK